MTKEEKALSQIKPDPVKYCAYCGKQMHRTRFESGRLEDLSAFIRRKYCCRECMKKAYVKQDGDKQLWTPAHHSARKLAFMVLGKEKKCEICGSTRNIDVHHIDHNENNNTPDNLMVVCRSCHNKIHHKEKAK